LHEDKEVEQANIITNRNTFTAVVLIGQPNGDIRKTRK
jgi:hypothetical protein